MKIDNNNTFDNNEHGNDFIADVGNCPDLTDQWNLITEKWQRGELTDLEQIVLHRALDILERKGIVVMKHGI